MTIYGKIPFTTIIYPHVGEWVTEEGESIGTIKRGLKLGGIE